MFRDQATYRLYRVLFLLDRSYLLPSLSPLMLIKEQLKKRALFNADQSKILIDKRTYKCILKVYQKT